MQVRKILIFSFLLIGFHGSTFAGGWPQPKGSFYLKLSEWWIVSDQHFNDQGNIQDNFLDFGYYSTSLYAEYGLTSRLTGIINFPFIIYAYSIPPSTIGKQSLWASGDIDIALKWALTYQKPVAISMTLFTGIPTGKDRNNGISGLQTGDGEWNQGFLFDAGLGYTIGKSSAWTNVHGGYNRRSESFADELIYGIESGINFSNNKITVLARIAGISALGESENALNINPQSLFSNFREYLSFSPEVTYHINESWGITAGMGTAFSGRNIFANTTFNLGVFHKGNLSN